MFFYDINFLPWISPLQQLDTCAHLLCRNTSRVYRVCAYPNCFCRQTATACTLRTTCASYELYMSHLLDTCSICLSMLPTCMYSTSKGTRLRLEYSAPRARERNGSPHVTIVCCVSIVHSVSTLLRYRGRQADLRVLEWNPFRFTITK